METFPERKKKINFGMKCFKYLLILINAMYLIISFLMISGATTLKVIFGEYYFLLWYTSTVDSLSSLWIATGCFLLALSIFGIVTAIKQSTFMANFYGVFLSLIFILQIAAAITGFTLITKADGIVRETLHELVYNYRWQNQATMDWVQTTFECCGNDGPSDWEKYGMYTTPYNWERSTTPDYWYRPSTYDYWGQNTTPDYDDWYSTTTTPPTTTLQTTTTRPGAKMPKSCCQRDTNYDNKYFTCDYYFTRGCHGPLYSIVAESVMMIGSSALIIGVVQLLGIICAFWYARTIRRSKTNRDIQRWAIHESMGFDRPAYVDVPAAETRPDEVKHI